MSKTKIRIIVALTTILILLSAVAIIYFVFCITNDIPSLISAAVDKSSGNFSIVYKTNVVVVESYDKNGKLLFDEKYRSSETSGGTVDVFYENGLLHVYLWRQNIMKVYDNSGKLIDEYESQHDANSLWTSFENKNGALTKTVGNTEYIYEQTPFFKRALPRARNVFYIQNDDLGKVIIWNSKLFK